MRISLKKSFNLGNAATTRPKDFSRPSAAGRRGELRGCIYACLEKALGRVVALVEKNAAISMGFSILNSTDEYTT